MRLRTLRTPLLSACGTLLLVASLGQQGGMAQTSPPAQASAQMTAPRWLAVTITKIKPELLTEYQDFVKNETIPALQKGGVKERTAWQTGVFGEGFQFAYVTPIEKFAQYDSDSPIVKALGEEGARAYNAKVRRFIVSSRTLGVETRPELSYVPDPMKVPKLAILRSTSVTPGRAADYEEAIKGDVLPAMKKAQVSGYFVSRTVFGGDVNEFTSLRYIDTFAELDQDSPLTRALGEAGAAAVGRKIAALTAHTEVEILRYNADLSFQVKTTSEAR